MSQILMDRASQGASSDSAAVKLAAQRTMTPAQVTAVSAELYRFLRMAQGLKVFSDTYRAGSTNLVGTTVTASMFAFSPKGGYYVSLAPGLSIGGGQLVGGHFTKNWKPVGLETPATFTLVMDGITVATRSLQGIQVLPYIYSLPSYMYQAFGGFIDELASSLLRSNLKNTVMSDTQRSTLNKIVSGDLKTMVADIQKVPQGYGTTVLMSGAVVSARMMAEADAMPIIKQQFPMLYSALVKHEGVGTTVLT